MPNFNVFFWHVQEMTEKTKYKVYDQFYRLIPFNSIYTHSLLYDCKETNSFLRLTRRNHTTYNTHIIFVLGYNYQKHYYSSPTSIYDPCKKRNRCYLRYMYKYNQKEDEKHVNSVRIEHRNKHVGSLINSFTQYKSFKFIASYDNPIDE